MYYIIPHTVYEEVWLIISEKNKEIVRGHTLCFPLLQDVFSSPKRMEGDDTKRKVISTRHRQACWAYTICPLVLTAFHLSLTTVLFSPVWTSCNCIHSLKPGDTELWFSNWTVQSKLWSCMEEVGKKLSLWFIYKPSSRDQSWARSVGCDEKLGYGPPFISQLLIWSELL